MLRKFNTFLDYIYVAGYSYLETQNVVKKIWLTKYKTSLIFLATAAFTGTEYHSTIHSTFGKLWTTNYIIFQNV
jgi:hypothetical protein